MLKPHKYMDFDVCVISISASVLSKLQSETVCSYHEVLQFIKNKHGDQSKYLFQSALSFLYLIGKIDYSVKTDFLEYIE